MNDQHALGPTILLSPSTIHIILKPVCSPATRRGQHMLMPESGYHSLMMININTCVLCGTNAPFDVRSGRRHSKAKAASPRYKTQASGLHCPPAWPQHLPAAQTKVHSTPQHTAARRSISRFGYVVS